MYDELDYVEKASESNLDSKTGNKGTKNYTKYSRDVNALDLKGYQGSAWCGTFQFALEAAEFGKEVALMHWNMTEKYVGYSCFDTWNAFEAAGKTSKTPKLGCLVIFWKSHMGRVVNIVDNKIWTVEGNTSPKKYDRNGGMVAEKSYDINDPEIRGFCIIDFEESSDVSSASGKEIDASIKSDSVAKGQKWLNSNYGNLLKEQKGELLKVDGSYGPKTRAAALCVWKDVVNRKYRHNLTPSNENFYDSCLAAAADAVINKGADGTLPYIAQLILAAKVHYTGEMDAHFGGKTEDAVKAFQAQNKLPVIGTVTPETWYKIFN